MSNCSRAVFRGLRARKPLKIGQLDNWTSKTGKCPIAPGPFRGGSWPGVAPACTAGITSCNASTRCDLGDRGPQNDAFNRSAVNFCTLNAPVFTACPLLFPGPSAIIQPWAAKPVLLCLLLLLRLPGRVERPFCLVCLEMSGFSGSLASLLPAALSPSWALSGPSRA